MSLNVCAHCTTKFAIGLPHCPQCGNADYYEEGSMAKITRHGGPSYVAAAEDIAQALVEVVAVPAPDVAPPADVEVVDEEPAVEVAPPSKYEPWLLVELRDECVRRGLPKTGNKDELAARLTASDTAPEPEPEPAAVEPADVEDPSED